MNVVDYTALLDNPALFKRLLHALINAKLKLKISDPIIFKTAFLKKLHSWLSKDELENLKIFSIILSQNAIPSSISTKQSLELIKARQSSINARDVSYYGVNYSLYSYIINSGHYIKFKDSVSIIITEKYLTTLLKSFHQSSSQIILIALLFDGHASAAIITKNSLKEYHAYFQDSSYTEGERKVL
ncbi:hypothetical protein [Rickettsia endosymbiont of Urophora cardui]|uniref:hypothetical protein n=1 Tax=Rickettsia endosymbiont of Urophora cardui TaxID=3066265 RepID=UPI00313BFC8F